MTINESSASRYSHHAICTLLPAWEIFVGKSTKIYALPLITPHPKAESSLCAGIRKGKSLEAAAIKIFVAFYKKGSKP
ncbi:hypothetical protein CBW18_18470 [Pedobacter sp. AJM]|nr:hypothetical protein CBW18_18470 [Pedobacter sp. AJM]